MSNDNVTFIYCISRCISSVFDPTYPSFSHPDTFCCACLSCACIDVDLDRPSSYVAMDIVCLFVAGGDRGTQYRSGIYVYSAEQLQVAQAQKAVAEVRLGQVVVTEIVEAPQYWPAEDYHQDYLWKGGQEKTKGSLKPIQCYGNRGPIKDLSKPGIEALLRSSPVGSATKDEL